ncbi:RNA-dependent RNA polymerase 1 [Hordeum vulgare]|nr:RNA-dependent RNA polymerase 1 [Hordeum vulgare]
MMTLPLAMLQAMVMEIQESSAGALILLKRCLPPNPEYVAANPTDNHRFASSLDGVVYAGVGVLGMEDLTNDDKVEEMLDDITSKGNKVVNITVMRSDAPTTADLNIGHLYEEQVPLFEFGVPLVYEVDTRGVLFPSPVKPQQQRVLVMNTQESSCLLKLKGPSEPEFALDYGSERHEYFVETD